MMNIDYRWHEPNTGWDDDNTLKSITFDGPNDVVQAKFRGFIAGGLWLERVTIL